MLGRHLLDQAVARAPTRPVPTPCFFPVSATCQASSDRRSLPAAAAHHQCSPRSRQPGCTRTRLTIATCPCEDPDASDACWACRWCCFSGPSTDAHAHLATHRPAGTSGSGRRGVARPHLCIPAKASTAMALSAIEPPSSNQSRFVAFARHALSPRRLTRSSCARSLPATCMLYFRRMLSSSTCKRNTHGKVRLFVVCHGPTSVQLGFPYQRTCCPPTASAFLTMSGFCTSLHAQLSLPTRLPVLLETLLACQLAEPVRACFAAASPACLHAL